ncbi:MAG: invasion associated locus B family protein [Pseudomonadota bacterium]
MKRSILGAAIALCIGYTGLAPITLAQEAEAPAPATETAPADPSAATAPLADPAQSEFRIRLRETHGAWEVRCAPNDSECFMYQLAYDANNNPVAEINVIRLEEGSPAEAGITVLTPLGTLLRPGITITVDGGERRSYPFIWCDNTGCFARFALSPEEVAGFRSGTSASMTLFSVGAPGTPVELAISLDGFTAGMEALNPIQN